MKSFQRRQFLKLLCAGAAGAPAWSLWSAGNDQLRGDRVGWARLKVAHPEWRRHAASDPELMRFFQQNTTLNIDPKWYVADVASLAEMSRYPVLFAQTIQPVQEQQSRANLAEFVRRGGFLLIDACCNRNVNPDFDVFYREQLAVLAAILPEAHVDLLPPDHAVYHCIFAIPNGHPPHSYFQGKLDSHKQRFGLYGITVGARMVGLLTLSGLQCGWDHVIAPAGHNVACMKMLTNIYVYAMAQGA